MQNAKCWYPPVADYYCRLATPSFLLLHSSFLIPYLSLALLMAFSFANNTINTASADSLTLSASWFNRWADFHDNFPYLLVSWRNFAVLVVPTADPATG
jgi:hypothetical protein